MQEFGSKFSIAQISYYIMLVSIIISVFVVDVITIVIIAQRKQ